MPRPRTKRPTKLSRQPQAASNEAQVGQWLRALTTVAAVQSNLELLYTQDLIADMLVGAPPFPTQQPFTAMHLFTQRIDSQHGRNEANFFLALALFGCRSSRGDVTEISIKRLVPLARRVAVKRGLADAPKLPDSDFIAMIDDVLMEMLPVYRTTVDTARLMICNRRPAAQGSRDVDSGPANYGAILFQRLLLEIGYTPQEQRRAALLAEHIGELYPDSDPDELQAQCAPEPETASAAAAFHNVRERAYRRARQKRTARVNVQTYVIRQLEEALTPQERLLWQIGGDIETIPELHWEHVLDELADPRTGEIPTANTVHQRWARLRAKIRRHYRLLTGRVSPVGESLPLDEWRAEVAAERAARPRR